MLGSLRGASFLKDRLPGIFVKSRYAAWRTDVSIRVSYKNRFGTYYSCCWNTMAGTYYYSSL